MIPEDVIEDISNVAKNLMNKASITDYTYEIEGKSESGENYMGEVIFFKIIPKGSEKDTLHLVMKTAKRSTTIRENLPIEVFYNREIYMYSDVFPAYRAFIKEVNPNFDFDFIPKVFYFNKTHGRETIVMKNLKYEGYKLRDRKKPWNLEHSLYVMEKYGKLHALSIALEDQRPEVFMELRKNLGDTSHVWEERADYRKFYQGPFEHVMGLLRKIGREDLVAKYDGLLEEAVASIFYNGAEEDDRIVIGHMDCWNNNFMFKYEDEDEIRPSSLRILDFQLAVIDSPAKDLSYNIYATGDGCTFSQFDLLIKTYHESLKNSLESLGSDPSKCFSMNEFRRHWRKYGLYGLFFSLLLIKISLLEKQDAPDLEDIVQCENILEGFDVKVTDQVEYDRRILDVFLHFGDNFL